jgi:hypothetical protein
MSLNELSFEAENLVVDWISFKFQHLDKVTETEITKYLFKLGFNSYQESGKLARPIKEPIQVDSSNKFEVLFVKEAPYWTGTILQFSGPNAFVFYAFVQKNLIDWTIFSSAVLGRFDLYYSRKNEREDKISTREFLENSQRELNQKGRNVRFEKNSKGFILGIGSRRSNNYFRIYERKNSLKFEHEMKGKFLQECHSLLVENRLEKFEQELSSHFLLSFEKLLPLNYSYMNWLVTKLRPIHRRTTLKRGLNSDYIKSEILMDTRSFVSLIQFLNYAQHLDYEIEYLGSAAFRKVIFQVRDFLEFQDPSVKPTNNYRLREIKDFFHELQAGLYVTSFSRAKFRSLVIVPHVEFEVCSTQKCLIGKVWLVEELFFHRYPFYMPNFFQQKLAKHELEARFKLFQVFSSASVEKEILVQEFFESYPSVLNNEKKTKVKECFIELVKILEEYNLIESKYGIFLKGVLYDTQELTFKNISEGFVIYEKLST